MRFLIAKNDFQVTCRKKAKPVSALNDFFDDDQKISHFESILIQNLPNFLDEVSLKLARNLLRSGCVRFFSIGFTCFFFWDRFNLCSHLWLGLWFSFSNCFAAAGWFLLCQRFFPFLWCFFRFLRFVFVLCNRLSRLPVYFFAPFLICSAMVSSYSSSSSSFLFLMLGLSSKGTIFALASMNAGRHGCGGAWGSQGVFSKMNECKAEDIVTISLYLWCRNPGSEVGFLIVSSNERLQGEEIVCYFCGLFYLRLWLYDYDTSWAARSQIIKSRVTLPWNCCGPKIRKQQEQNWVKRPQQEQIKMKLKTSHASSMQVCIESNFHPQPCKLHASLHQICAPSPVSFMQVCIKLS